MRWIGLILTLVAATILAWEAFGPEAPSPAAIEASPKHTQVYSAIGITIGFLLILLSPKRA